MSRPDESRAVPRRRALLLGAIGAAVVAVGAGLAWGLGPGAAPEAATISDTSGDTAVRSTPSAGAGGAGTGTSPAHFDLASLSPAVADQLEYVRDNWQSTSSEQFGFIDENDCVNFTSQSLLARGWQTDDEWWYSEDGDPWSHPTAWISSTSFMEYLEEHPERATALTDAQRDQVKVGDVVQFDWDDSGDRDHTGVVTSVETEADGSITILYAGHTDATWDRSVDWAITEHHPGGVAYYWSIPE